MLSPFYVTAAIDYVNAAPHLGTTYEKVGCDVLARHRRLRGDDVRFTMGSDEHSQSVERTARERSLSPDDFCTRQAGLFQSTWAAFDIHPTAYVRTSSDANRVSTNLFMQTLHDGGHVYKAPYRAWFCPSCERFYSDRDVSGGLCPVHETAVEWVEEENYFFRLSAFQQPLLDHILSHPSFIVPEPRRNEMLNVLRGGLEDISISRGFSTWGFPLPFDASQVVYVWFDALLSYVTGIGYGADEESFNRFWPADVHVIGKDITRFHAIMWPAMLMAAGLPLPRRIHAHGWITLGGQKLSKTKGVFIDPMSLVERFGSDAVRWVLMREIPFDRDGDFSLEAFVDRYNADLANDYGNLVSRTEKMVHRYVAGHVPTPAAREDLDDELRMLAGDVVETYNRAMDDLAFSEGLAAAMRLVARANKYIEEAAPWQLERAGDPRLATVCYELLEAVRVSTLLLHPVIPRATAAVARDLGIAIVGDVGEVVRTWEDLAPGSRVEVGDILFPRLDRDAVLEAG